jgi:hypothetical protein
VLDPGEECDPNRRCESDEDCEIGLSCDPATMRCVGQGGILPVTQCPDLPVTADFKKVSYATGVVTQEDCKADCSFDRSSCSYCGDGELDPGYNDAGSAQSPEVCDGTAKDPDEFDDFCKLSCFENPDAVDFAVACLNASCKSNCSGFVFLDPPPPPDPDPVEDLGCCLKAGESCAGNPPFPCCWALEHDEDDPEAGCDPVFNMQGQNIDFRCRAG